MVCEWSHTWVITIGCCCGLLVSTLGWLTPYRSVWQVDYCCHLVNSSCYFGMYNKSSLSVSKGVAALVSNTDDPCKSKCNFHWRVLPSETQRRVVWQKFTRISHWNFRATDLKLKAIQSCDTVTSVLHHTASTSDLKSIPLNVHEPGTMTINQRSMVKSRWKLLCWIVIY
jgi:hypothetical protein